MKETVKWVICEGYVFTHVCNSVHRGWSRSPSRGGGSPSQGSPSLWVSVRVESLSRGVSVQGVSVMETLPSMVTNGRYASYWNAFLLLVDFKSVALPRILENHSMRSIIDNFTQVEINTNNPAKCFFTPGFLASCCLNSKFFACPVIQENPIGTQKIKVNQETPCLKQYFTVTFQFE